MGHIHGKHQCMYTEIKKSDADTPPIIPTKQKTKQ